MSVNIRKPVLLTGAGFTANFDGFLAKDMRFRIMRNPSVKGRSQIVQLLQSKSSFEAVYNDVMTGDYDAQDKDALDEAVQTTYRLLVVLSVNTRILVNAVALSTFTPLAIFSHCLLVRTRPEATSSR